MKHLYFLLLLFFFIVGCDSKTRDDLNKTVDEIVYDSIEDIVTQPTKYEGKKVTIKGTVKSSTNIQIVKFYYVTDGENEIIVFTKSAVPLEGASIVVKGTVSQILKLDTEQVTGIKETSRG